MSDCQMCWNTWPSLEPTPFPRIPGEVQVCRNCGRSQKQVIAFIRSKGYELVTVSSSTGLIVDRFSPQAGSQTLSTDNVVDHNVKREEEPPDPPAKGARKAR